MEQTVRFRVLIEDEIKKLTLNGGIPSTVNELVQVIKDAYSITTEISLQDKDTDFDDFFTVDCKGDLKDKDTLKVVYVNVPQTITLTVVPQEGTPDTSDVSSLWDSQSLGSQDTVILSPTPSERQDPWPTVFRIPTFSCNTELALRQGNDMYLRDGTLLTSPNVKHDILEHLAEAIFSYNIIPMMPRGLQ